MTTGAFLEVIAALLIDRGPRERWEAFATGLRHLGYRVTDKPNQNPLKTDLLVVWNRHRHDAWAQKYEQAGAAVIVAENGYVGCDENQWTYYALALNHHNGAGRWFVGEGDRWSKLGIALASWREDGENILVLAQRGIGPSGVAMPRTWPQYITGRLRSVTKRNVVVRLHPKQERPPIDFTRCWAAVTWGSGAAIKALVAGIPVFHEMPNWIGGPAARFGIDDLENPFVGDRAPMLHRMSWAQWSLGEIASGEPFRLLLNLDTIRPA